MPIPGRRPGIPAHVPSSRQGGAVSGHCLRLDHRLLWQKRRTWSDVSSWGRACCRLFLEAHPQHRVREEEHGRYAQLLLHPWRCWPRHRRHAFRCHEVGGLGLLPAVMRRRAASPDTPRQSDPFAYDLRHGPEIFKSVVPGQDHPMRDRVPAGRRRRIDVEAVPPGPSVFGQRDRRNVLDAASIWVERERKRDALARREAGGVVAFIVGGCSRGVGKVRHSSSRPQGNLRCFAPMLSNDSFESISGN